MAQEGNLRRSKTIMKKGSQSHISVSNSFSSSESHVGDRQQDEQAKVELALFSKRTDAKKKEERKKDMFMNIEYRNQQIGILQQQTEERIDEAEMALQKRIDEVYKTFKDKL